MSTTANGSNSSRPDLHHATVLTKTIKILHRQEDLSAATEQCSAFKVSRSHANEERSGMPMRTTSVLPWGSSMGPAGARQPSPWERQELSPWLAVLERRCSSG
ncbi:hypothetical protein MHYP_G00122990 [Metynnis hypsauchen]